MNEENKTYNVVKYILLFFSLIIFIGGGVFAYYNYFAINDTKIDLSQLNNADDDFKETASSLGRKNDQIEIGQGDNRYVERNCYIDDLILKSGEKAKLYSRRIVTPFEDCSNFAKERVCSDGFMLGDINFKYSKCEKNLDCQLLDGNIIKNEKEIKLYSKKTVPYGETCERYASVRKCKDTILTGDRKYIYKECRVSYDNSCDTGNGNILKDDHSYIYYKKQKVEYGEHCKDFAKRIFCRKSIIEGADITVYKYSTCKEAISNPCYIDGHKIEHNLSEYIKLYSLQYSPEGGRGCDFYSANFICENGELKNEEEYTTDQYKYYDCDRI